MTNPTQDVQAILRAIVNDLEKTSAVLSYISREVAKVVPSSMASQIDGMNIAAHENKQFYDELRKQIDKLNTDTL